VESDIISTRLVTTYVAALDWVPSKGISLTYYGYASNGYPSRSLGMKGANNEISPHLSVHSPSNVTGPREESKIFVRFGRSERILSLINNPAKQELVNFATDVNQTNYTEISREDLESGFMKTVAIPILNEDATEISTSSALLACEFTDSTAQPTPPPKKKEKDVDSGMESCYLFEF